MLATEYALPTALRLYVARIDDFQGELYPEETKIVARAVAKRKREFTAGRTLARYAMKPLGVGPIPLLQGDERQALWPKGIRGSIAHDDAYVSVCVATDKDLVSVGIDIEIQGRVKQKLWPEIMTADELLFAKHLASDESMAYATILFGIKESFYKMQHPMTNEFLEFAEVEVRMDESFQNISIETKHPKVRQALQPYQLTAAWMRHESRLLTYVLLH